MITTSHQIENINEETEIMKRKEWKLWSLSTKTEMKEITSGAQHQI